jgi:hypothetical protein
MLNYCKKTTARDIMMVQLIVGALWLMFLHASRHGAHRCSFRRMRLHVSRVRRFDVATLVLVCHSLAGF